MFDIGTGEVALIAVIALLVLGPERLPVAARTAGALLRKARQSWNNVRDEIERELAAEELKKSLQQIDPRPELQKLHDSVVSTQPMTRSVNEAPHASVDATIAPPSDPVDTSTPPNDAPPQHDDERH